MDALDVDQRACVDVFAEAIEKASTIVVRAGAKSGNSHNGVRDEEIRKCMRDIAYTRGVREPARTLG